MHGWDVDAFVVIVDFVVVVGDFVDVVFVVQASEVRARLLIT